MAGNLKKIVKNPWWLYALASSKGLTRFVPDKPHLSALYRAYIGKKLNLENPITFNEKLQWLKIHDHNPLYNTLVDKYRVKPWVAERIGEDHVTKTYAMWENVEDIDISGLPERFVLKTNHDCGGIVICRDRSTFDLEAAKKKLAKHLKTNYFWWTREWPYKDVEPCVFAEEYLDPNTSDGDLYDYKLLRFSDGRLVMQAMTDRFTDGKLSKTFFDEDWHPLPASEGGQPTRPNLVCPERFGQMKEMAGKLGEGLPFVRVDFYESNGGLYFGELTFYPKAGFERFEPEEWDVTFGSWIDLTDVAGGGWLLVSEASLLWLHEESVSTSATEGLVDYKFYCFDGEPKIMLACTGRAVGDTRFDFYDMDFNHLDIKQEHTENADLPIEKPSTYDLMVDSAKKLSVGIPHLRVDFYEANGNLYFGECTFFDSGGFGPFEPDEWDEKLGNMIDLSNVGCAQLS